MVLALLRCSHCELSKSPGEVERDFIIEGLQWHGSDGWDTDGSGENRSSYLLLVIFVVSGFSGCSRFGINSNQRCRNCETEAENVTIVTSLQPTIPEFTEKEIFHLAREKGYQHVEKIDLLREKLNSWDENTLWFRGSEFPGAGSGCNKIMLIEDEWRWLPPQKTKNVVEYYQVVMGLDVQLKGPTRIRGQTIEAVGGFQTVRGLLSVVSDESAVYGGIPLQFSATCELHKRVVQCTNSLSRYCPVYEVDIGRVSLLPGYGYGSGSSGSVIAGPLCQAPCPDPVPCPDLEELNQFFARYTFYDLKTNGFALFRRKSACENSLSDSGE